MKKKRTRRTEKLVKEKIKLYNRGLPESRTFWVPEREKEYLLSGWLGARWRNFENKKKISPS